MLEGMMRWLQEKGYLSQETGTLKGPLILSLDNGSRAPHGMGGLRSAVPICLVITDELHDGGELAPPPRSCVLVDQVLKTWDCPAFLCFL
jgi:hypothetical protein